MEVTLQNVYKRYGAAKVLQGVSARLSGCTVLMGPSGCGKTTLSRLILGLEKPDNGHIQAPGKLVAVFQEDRLCPQLSAVENVALVCGRAVEAAGVVRALKALGLEGESLQKPAAELSGGQKRRVALARALLAPADGVVLDEPFKGLDEAACLRAMEWTKRAAGGRWLLLITHDEAQARYFGGRLWRLGEDDQK